MSGEEGSAFARLRRLARTPVPFPRLLPRRKPRPRDVKEVVRDSGLPEPICALVLEIVERARLWRSERADVADELLAHLRDGLDAGAEPAGLVSGFGEPGLTAKLIRRAMRRKRPLAWRAWRRSLQGVAALAGLLFVVYLYAVVRFFGGGPVISRDYLAELNAPILALAPEERAWPLYREALLALRDLPQPAWTARPGEYGWTELTAAVEAHAPALAIVRAAAARRGLGYVVGFTIDEEDQALWPGELSSPGPEAGLIAVVMPYLGELQKLSRLLAVDMHRAAAAGDGELVAADFEAAIGMAGHVREATTMIGGLVSLAHVSKALDTLGEILASHPQVLSEAQLRRLAHEVAALDRERLRVRLDGERMWFQDIVQRVYTDDGNGDGHVSAAGLQWLSTGVVVEGRPHTPQYLMAPAVAMVMAGRKEMSGLYERLIGRVEAEWSRPLWEQDVDAFDREVEAMARSPLSNARYWPVLLLMPAQGRAGVQAEHALQRRDAVLVAIALELYRRRSGAWPASLDALVPDLLPSVPPDRFDGKPLRYRLVDGKPLLYSVGSDRDDDGGTPTAAQHPGLYLGDGDWILWQG